MVRNRRYCKACSPTNDPQWRASRAQRAQRFAMEAYREHASQVVAGLTPAQAYARGYEAGYYLAYRRWKKWATALWRGRGARTDAA